MGPKVTGTAVARKLAERGERGRAWLGAAT